MDIRNYFYFLWRMKWKALIAGVIFAVLGFIYTYAFEEYRHEAVFFVTIGMEQDAYPEDAEAFGARGVTEADYYFAQTVQGWTMDPAFSNAVYDELSWVRDGSIAISARQQERQNIIFSISMDDNILGVQYGADATSAVLQTKLNNYNSVMQTDYKFYMGDVSIVTHAPSYVKNVGFGFVVGVLLLIVMALCYEFLVGIVSFPYQVEKILEKGSVDPTYLAKGGYILGVGCKVYEKYGREVAHKDDLKKGDYLLIVKMGIAREEEIETLKRLVANVEWITC